MGEGREGKEMNEMADFEACMPPKPTPNAQAISACGSCVPGARSRVVNFSAHRLKILLRCRRSELPALGARQTPTGCDTREKRCEG